MVLGVLDENSYTIMDALNMYDGAPKSFPQLLSITRLPKSSLYVALMRMLENGLVERVEFNYRLSGSGRMVYDTFKRILENRVQAAEAKRVERLEKRGAFDWLIEGFRKIFGRR